MSDASHGRSTQIFVRTIVPRDIEHAPSFHRAPDTVGDDRDRRVANLADITHAGNLLRFLVVERRNLAADRRTTRQHGILHFGQTEVDAEYCFAFDLGRRIHAGKPLADDLVILALLQRHVGGDRQRRSFADKFAITQTAVRCGMLYVASSRPCIADRGTLQVRAAAEISISRADAPALRIGSHVVRMLALPPVV